jgi:hypothetical protein
MDSMCFFDAFMLRDSCMNDVRFCENFYFEPKLKFYIQFELKIENLTERDFISIKISKSLFSSIFDEINHIFFKKMIFAAKITDLPNPVG